MKHHTRYHDKEWTEANVKLAAEIQRVMLERDLLAGAIADGAVRAGIISSPVGLDGQQLLMLCDDLASAALCATENAASVAIEAASSDLERSMEASSQSESSTADSAGQHVLRGWISGSSSTGLARLLALGVKPGPVGQDPGLPETSTWYNCEVSPQAFEKLHELWGEFIWGLE